jgi:hypothetical protein
LTVEFFFSTYILCSCVTLFSLLSIGFPSHTDASVHFCPYKDRLAASTIKSSFLHEFCPFYSIIDAFLRTVKFQLFVLVERCRLLFWKKIVIVFLIKFFYQKVKIWCMCIICFTSWRLNYFYDKAGTKCFW